MAYQPLGFFENAPFFTCRFLFYGISIFINTIIIIFIPTSGQNCPCHNGITAHAVVSLAGVLQKLRGRHARQEACPWAACKQEVWPWGLNGHLENYINPGRFWPRQNKAERQRSFTEKTALLPLCVCVCAFQPSLTLLPYPYIHFK